MPLQLGAFSVFYVCFIYTWCLKNDAVFNLYDFWLKIANFSHPLRI